MVQEYTHKKHDDRANKKRKIRNCEELAGDDRESLPQ